MTPREELRLRQAVLLVGETMPSELEQAERRRARQRFLNEVESQAERRRRWFGASPASVARWSLGAVSAAASVVFLLRAPHHTPVVAGAAAVSPTEPARGPGPTLAAQHVRRQETASVHVGEVIRRDTHLAIEEADHLQFSDGSEVSLGASADVVLSALGAEGAVVSLRAGTIAASIVHHSAATAWNFHAGPFDVHVIGTAFDLGWDPKKAKMLLSMREGVVRVEGCGAPAREVRAPDHVELSCAELVQAPAPELARKSQDITTQPAAAGAEPSALEEPIAPPAPTAEQLAAGGRWEEAFRILERDFDARVAGSSVAEATRMGDIARLSGHLSFAERAYRRADAVGAPGVASLELAKIYMRSGRAPEAMVSADRAASNPVLAEDAALLGIEAAVAIGDRESAQSRAKSYAERFPHGRHIEDARRLMP